MAHLIELEDLQGGYIELIDYVSKHGDEVAPRGLPIVEITDCTFTIENLTNVLPVQIGRNLNLKIAAIEALQLIAGWPMPELVLAASPMFENFTEPDGSFHGAYGARIGRQTQEVITKLRRDKHTRQAVITLWDPLKDNGPGRRDYPCTIALGFRIRRELLDLSVLMRSNDVWLGTAYDVFQFTQLQWSIAHELDLGVGRYSHTAWSLHVYERDMPKLALLHKPDAPYLQHPRGIVSTSFETFDGVALEIMERPLLAPSKEETHRWYCSQMMQIHSSMTSGPSPTPSVGGGKPTPGLPSGS